MLNMQSTKVDLYKITAIPSDCFKNPEKFVAVSGFNATRAVSVSPVSNHANYSACCQ